MGNSDVWHAPLLLDINTTGDPNTGDHQLVTVMLAPAEDQYVPSAPVTKNQTMYEHETVNVCVKQLEGIVEVAKGNLVSDWVQKCKKTRVPQSKTSLSCPFQFLLWEK